MSYSYHRSARSPVTALVVAVIWAALVAAFVFLEAALWVIGVIALFTLPALADLLRNPESGLSLSDETLDWFTGRRTASVALDEISHMRLDTRLDFSVRATVVLKTGRKIRLPFEATPPHRTFEEELLARDLKVERHHFQLIQ